MRASQAPIGQLIEREVSRGIAIEKIVLAGFSQGGAVALQTGLRYPRKLAGIMALSTYLPLAESFANEAAAENRRTPIFMAHGTEDPVDCLRRWATTSRVTLTELRLQRGVARVFRCSTPCAREEVARYRDVAAAGPESVIRDS